MRVISGYFGLKMTGVYEAPLPGNSYFFSNNIALKEVAQSRGWTFVYLEDMPLSNEPRIASLQSKCIKFLQFDRARIWGDGDESILYFDHKFFVQKHHIDFVEERCNSKVLVRNTPAIKLKLQDEINAALPQKRYREVMKETVEWVNDKIKNQGYSSNNRIMNTGLIYFKNPNAAESLCREVYSACWLLGQPECQIIWATLSQRYENIITRIDWSEMEMTWREPSV